MSPLTVANDMRGACWTVSLATAHNIITITASNPFYTRKRALHQATLHLSFTELAQTTLGLATARIALLL
jgi:hypothetical protein